MSTQASLGLTDGRWVPRGAILEWEPGELTPAGSMPAPEPLPTLTPADVAKMIACPVCLARVDQMCRTTTGRHRAPHPARLVIKRCPCGEPIKAGRKVCDDCRAEARRVNARIGMRNTRARRRAQKEVA